MYILSAYVYVVILGTCTVCTCTLHLHKHSPWVQHRRSGQTLLYNISGASDASFWTMYYTKYALWLLLDIMYHVPTVHRPKLQFQFWLRSRRQHPLRSV